MDKNKINQLRRYVSVALQSSKIYVDLGGDTFGVKILSSLFKWPDVVYDLLDVIDEKEKSDDALVKDIGEIMLNPLEALGLAYLDAVDIPKDEKDAYRTILHSRTINSMAEISKHRDIMVNILTKLVALKEKKKCA